MRTLFIKTTRAKGYEYIKLVESYRESGTTKHRVLYNFGRADAIQKDESFLNVVKRLCDVAGVAKLDTLGEKHTKMVYSAQIKVVHCLLKK